MTCSNCGEEVALDREICPNCGQPVRASSTSGESQPTATRAGARQHSRKDRLVFPLGISSIFVMLCTLLLTLDNLGTDQPPESAWFWSRVVFAGGLLSALLGIAALVLGVIELARGRISGLARLYSITGLTGVVMSVLFCVYLMMLAALQLEWEKPWDSHTQEIQGELDNLAATAYHHYLSPAEKGGGNGAFDDSKGGTAWRIPEKRDTTDYAYYMILSISAEQLVLVGIARRCEWKGEGDDSEFRNANGQTGMIQLTLTYNPNRRDSTGYGRTTKDAMIVSKDN